MRLRPSGGDLVSLEVSIRKSFPAFELDVELEVGTETLGFLGESGCGKSLTMRCIAGIETPDEGRIVVNGRVFYDSERKINLTSQQRKTALLFQNYMLFPNLTVAQNVAAGIGKEVSRTEAAAIVAAELHRFGLDGFDERYPAQLSGGQQQRVAIARALVSKPAIVLADEPTGNLDSRTSSDVLGLLKATSSKFHQTLVMITHNNEIAQLADRIIRIEDGRIFE